MKHNVSNWRGVEYIVKAYHEEFVLQGERILDAITSISAFEREMFSLEDKKAYKA